MAHWDDSGTAVGYEGEKGDKLIRPQICDHEFLSNCCGAMEHSTFASFCSQCKEHSMFECNCGKTRSSRND